MPSLINELLFDEVKSIVDEGHSVLIIDPAGLKAADSLALRRDLHDIGARMKVTKRRVLRQAFGEDVQPYLEGKGTVGVVSAADVAAAAKIINKLVKDEKVTVRAGIIEGRAMDARTASSLADLPSKEELQSRLLGTLQAPMSNFVRLLNEVPASFARLLAAYRDEKSK